MSELESNNTSEEELLPDSEMKAEVPPRQKVYIKTYGCQMNEYDTQKIFKILENRYEPVDSPDKADLVMVNTCSVRDRPEKKLYSMLGEFRDLKKIKPELLIGVAGCVAQQEGARILKRNSAVDFVVGTHNLSLVPGLIDRRREGAASQVAVDYRDEWEDLPLGMVGEGRTSVLVTISRGCNKNCSYCIVPTTRGKEVSRSLDEIKKEIRIAIHRGAKEVMLLGQTVNSWGADLVPRRKFVELLQEISEIEGLARIRFMSPHPQEIREDFIELVTQNPKVCHHVHMPLQSGSDVILQAMNRNYRRARYLKIIEELKSRVPDIAVTTDIIVGFPGETEDDFEQTLDIMRTVQFDTSYSYMFSPRPGTAAALLANDVPDEVKLHRVQALQELQGVLTAARLKLSVGREAEVLIEGPSRERPEILYGRTSQNVVLNFDGFYPRLATGQLARVMVTEAKRYTLLGTPLEIKNSGEGTQERLPASS